MSASWPTVPLGQLLRRSDKMIELLPDIIYREVTVRVKGKGVVERRAVAGLEIASDRRHIVSAGQFILSKIDARHGASGIIPNSLDGAVVTNDFPLFNVVQDRLVPKFLEWMSKTAAFIELCGRASEGTTNRVRLSEQRFLGLEISLPPLAEQHRIVARIDALAAKIDEARGLRKDAMGGAHALFSTTLDLVFSDRFGHWIESTVEAVSETIDAGWSPQCEELPAKSGEWGVLKTTAVQWATFWPHENKRLPASIAPRPELTVRAGDVLITRAGPMKRVGVAAVARESHPFLMLSDKIIRIRPKLNLVDPRFMEFSIASPTSQEYLVARKTGLADAQVNISQGILKNTPLAYPDLPEQRRIVGELDALHAKIDSVKSLQAETAAELDALLPAILDRAFKGEL
jgi:type I restriction enzyme, S subunit